MCGRYSFAPKPKQLQESLADIVLPAQLEISFNIAPTHRAYVITRDFPRQMQQMEWGLVPRWSRDGKNSGKMINARAEGIEEKPSFREPVHAHRCLVPADSFYEWRREADGSKTPYRIFRRDGQLLFLAGIWDEWKSGAETRRTFSIITTTPNQEMTALHDRMPVILNTPEACEKWLSTPDTAAALAMLQPAPDHTLAFYRVSDRLNKPGPDDPALQEEVPEPLRLF